MYNHRLEQAGRSVRKKKSAKTRRETLNDFTDMSLLQHLNAAPRVEDFRHRIGSLLRIWEIDFFCHHGITAAQALDPFGNYPSAYLQEYARQEFHRFDMILQFAQCATRIRELVFQDEIDHFARSAPFSTNLLSINAEMARVLRNHGIRSSGAIFIDSSNTDRRFLFRLASCTLSPADFQVRVTKYIERLKMLASAVDLVGYTKFRNHFHSKRTHPVHLSERPLQLLDLLRKDLTLNEAAKILGISIATANGHIAAAKKALGAETTTGAIWAAHLEGLLG